MITKAAIDALHKDYPDIPKPQIAAALHGAFERFGIKDPEEIKADVVILCGGKGMRIRDLIAPGTPKALARIGERVFLDILMQYLVSRGFRRFILALGYGAEKILGKFGQEMFDPLETEISLMGHHYGAHNVEITFSLEKAPLGTGGALLNSRSEIKTDPFFVINGDTFCRLDFRQMLWWHLTAHAESTVAVDHDLKRAGIYLFTKAIFYCLAHFKTFPLNLDSVPIKNNHFTHSPFFDIGSPEGLDAFRSSWSAESLSGI